MKSGGSSTCNCASMSLAASAKDAGRRLSKAERAARHSRKIDVIVTARRSATSLSRARPASSCRPNDDASRGNGVSPEKKHSRKARWVNASANECRNDNPRLSRMRSRSSAMRLVTYLACCGKANIARRTIPARETASATCALRASTSTTPEPRSSRAGYTTSFSLLRSTSRLSDSSPKSHCLCSGWPAEPALLPGPGPP